MATHARVAVGRAPSRRRLQAAADLVPFTGPRSRSASGPLHNNNSTFAAPPIRKNREQRSDRCPPNPPPSRRTRRAALFLKRGRKLFAPPPPPLLFFFLRSNPLLHPLFARQRAWPVRPRGETAAPRNPRRRPAVDLASPRQGGAASFTGLRFPQKYLRGNRTLLLLARARRGLTHAASSAPRRHPRHLPTHRPSIGEPREQKNQTERETQGRAPTAWR